MEPISTTVFNGLIRTFATTTKICTGARFTQARAQGCVANPAPPYSPAPRARAGGRASVVRLSAIHFQGSYLRQVRCYTLLRGFRFQWQPSCRLEVQTSFVVCEERTHVYLNAALGSSRIASSTYQKWPTLNAPFAARDHSSIPRLLPI